MAKTLQQAQANWERKTAGAGGRWKGNVAGKGGEYASGIAQVIGSPPSSDIVNRWQSGVDSVSASDFQNSISGKGDKWAANYRAAMTGA